MIGLPTNLKIFVALEPCDLRKSFNGLVTIADALNEKGLHSGALFIFTNKRRNRLKVLYYVSGQQSPSGIFAIAL